MWLYFIILLLSFEVIAVDQHYECNDEESKEKTENDQQSSTPAQ